MTFRDTDENFQLQGDLLKMVNNNKYNVDIAEVSGKKIMYDFGQEMLFGEKAPDDISERDGFL